MAHGAARGRRGGSAPSSGPVAAARRSAVRRRTATYARLRRRRGGADCDERSSPARCERAVDDYAVAEAARRAGAAVARPPGWPRSAGRRSGCSPSACSRWRAHRCSAAPAFWAWRRACSRGTDPLGDVRRRVLGDQRAADGSRGRAGGRARRSASLDELGASAAGRPGPARAAPRRRGSRHPRGGHDRRRRDRGGSGRRGCCARRRCASTARGSAPADRAPSGVAERFARIPEGDQVRIERYEAPGRAAALRSSTSVRPRPSRRSPTTSRGISRATSRESPGCPPVDPRDRARDGGGRHPAGRRRAVRGLLAGRAGRRAARRLRALERRRARDLRRADRRASTLPAELPGIAVRHTDDLVPALGGPHPVSGQLQVERRGVPAGRPDSRPTSRFRRTSAAPTPATAQAIDQATSAEVRAELARLDAFAQDYASPTGLDGHDAGRFHAERARYLAAGGERAQDDADQPGDDAEHHGAEHAPPEVPADDEAEPEQAADPRDEPEQQPVDDERDQAESQHVERERDDPDDVADDAVDEAEDQAEQQVGPDRGPGVVGGVGLRR